MNRTEACCRHAAIHSFVWNKTNPILARAGGGAQRYSPQARESDRLASSDPRVTQHGRSARLQSLGLQHGDSGRRGQEFDERLGGVHLFGTGADGGRIDTGELDLRRQWPDQLGAGIRQYLADLGHADLGFTIRHGMRGRIGRRQQLGLALQLLGDPEALEKTLEIDSSCTLLDITNRLGIEQRALERLSRADVGLRRRA